MCMVSTCRRDVKCVMCAYVIGSEKTTLIARGILIEYGRFTTKYVILSLTVNFRISKVQSFAYRL